MIDADGFRPNVGIIVLGTPPGAVPQVLWAKRVGQDAWQFPQGGIQRGESPEQACFRELEEELGLKPAHVEVLGVTADWLRYRLPSHLQRRGSGSRVCIGQKQRWFLLRLLAPTSKLRLDASPKPEFDAWQWVDWWLPLVGVVDFKREVYRQALTELAPLAGAAPAPPAARSAPRE